MGDLSADRFPPPGGRPPAAYIPRHEFDALEARVRVLEDHSWEHEVLLWRTGRLLLLATGSTEEEIRGELDALRDRLRAAGRLSLLPENLRLAVHEHKPRGGNHQGGGDDSESDGESEGDHLFHDGSFPLPP